MARKKVKLAFIENDTARKSTYKNREKGLLKKVDELATLCGVEACAIIYGPYEPQPEIWPSASGVQNVLSKFMTKSEFEQRKKMVNQESFLKERISKAEKQFEKQWKDNREKERTMFLFECLSAGNVVQKDMSVAGLNHLAWMIDQNLKEISRRIEADDRNSNTHQSENQIQMEQSLLLPLALPPPTMSNNEDIAMMSHGHLPPPPPPQPTAPNNDEIAMNNNDIMMNGGELEAIPFGYDANL
ncbi:agamous-like MADS-box protein AGL80 [Vicia villosa]|uniref:agamous-like MADS-box protein AGL80 n=1 Tax=Vicia villosa TaxID=3911 RepID=UPI00273A903C|nr:agamous-like MADS-box protein AGL80 [Vicia villosa]